MQNVDVITRKNPVQKWIYSSSALHIQVFTALYFHTMSHIKIFPAYIQYYKVAKVHKTIHGSHHPSPHYVTD